MSENTTNTLPKGKEDVIVVDDGYRLIRVQNQLGEEIGKFRFNPTDFNMVNRYNEVADQFGEVVKPVADANITKDGEAADEDSVELLNEAEDKMIELMDYVLNCDSREAFFSKTHMFTPTDGVFYCEKVLESIENFVKIKFAAETKKVNARVAKHTANYRTGKHRRGDR